MEPPDLTGALGWETWQGGEGCMGKWTSEQLDLSGEEGSFHSGALLSLA